MPETVAIVTITDQLGTVERELRVLTLGELFEVCCDAPPSHLVRVSIRGSKGEIRFNFASFIHP